MRATCLQGQAQPLATYCPWLRLRCYRLDSPQLLGPPGQRTRRHCPPIVSLAAEAKFFLPIKMLSDLV